MTDLVQANSKILKPAEAQQPSLEWDFSNPKADLAVIGPNEEFLRAIQKAFKVDGCFARYGTELNHKLFKNIVVFAVGGLSRSKKAEFTQYVYYLYSRLEDRQGKDALQII